MFTALKNIRATLNVVPRVMAVVMLLEELLDDTVPGAKKKQMALDALEEVGLPDRFINIADDTIDLVVSILNAVGVFESTERTPDVQESELSQSAYDARLRAMRDLE